MKLKYETKAFHKHFRPLSTIETLIPMNLTTMI